MIGGIYFEKKNYTIIIFVNYLVKSLVINHASFCGIHHVMKKLDYYESIVLTNNMQLNFSMYKKPNDISLRVTSKLFENMIVFELYNNFSITFKTFLFYLYNKFFLHTF